MHAVFFLIRAKTRKESLQYALRDLGNVCGLAQSTQRQFEVVRRLGLRGEDLVAMHIGSDEKAWQCQAMMHHQQGALPPQVLIFVNRGRTFGRSNDNCSHNAG